MSATDWTLLERWRRQRDADAFAELVQRYSGMVFSSARRVLKDPLLAEDVAQECFIKLMQEPASVRISLGAWLHTVAVYRSLDCLKSAQRRSVREQQFNGQMQEATAAVDPGLQEILDRVDEAIEGLPPKLRGVVVGRFLEGLSHQELARQLGVAESTVRYRAEQGVEQLRATLKRAGITATVSTLVAAFSESTHAAPSALVARIGKLAASGTVPAASWSFAALAPIVKFSLAGVLVLGAWGLLWQATHRPFEPLEKDEPSEAAPSGANLSQSVDSTNRAPVAPSEQSTSFAAAPAAAEPVTEEQTAEPISIAGRVYDAETGEGISGASIRVAPAGGGAYLHEGILTSTEGNFKVPLLPDGTYSVRLKDLPKYPDPRRSRSRNVTLSKGEVQRGIDFALQAGIVVAGQVVDASGTPVPGAEVAAKTEVVVNAIRTNSDQQGNFVLYMPAPADSLMIQARNDSAESTSQTDLKLTQEGLAQLVLRLDQPRSAGISGRVVDGEGKAVASAGLHLLRKNKVVFDMLSGEDTDGEGQFSLSKLPAGDYAVLVVPKNATEFSTSEEYLRLTLREGEQRENIEIIFGEKGGLAIAGRVVDGAGKPVEGVRISCYGGDVMESVHSDDKGEFVVTGLEDREYELRTMHHAYSSTIVTVPAGTLDVDLVLKGQGSLRLRVLRAEDGAPLTSFSVAFLFGRARDLDAQLFASGQSIDSASGEYTNSTLNAGELSVAAWAEGYAPEWKVVTVEEGRQTEAEFQLSESRRASGYVMDKKGEPIADALLYFARYPDLGALDRTAAARTGPGGAFELSSLPQNAARLYASRPGYGIGSDPISEEMKIILPDAATIEGQISGNTSPALDHLVNVRYPEDPFLPSSYTKPDEQGRFRLTGLSPGTAEVSVYPNLPGQRQFVRRQMLIGAGQNHALNFIFTAGVAALRGKMLSAGTPVTDSSLELVRVQDDQVDGLRTNLQKDGIFEFTQVWPGNLSLRLTRADPKDPYTPVIDEFELTLQPGQVIVQEFEVDELE